MPKMAHPEIKTLGEYMDDSAFVQLWEPRGWVKVDQATEFAGTVLERVVTDLEDSDDVSVDELKWLLRYRGHDGKGTKRDDIVKQFRESFVPGAVEAPVTDPDLTVTPTDKPDPPRAVQAKLDNKES